MFALIRRFTAASFATVLMIGTIGAPTIAVVDDSPQEGDPGNLHIVLFSDPPLAAYDGGIAGLAPTDPGVTGATRLDTQSAASQAYLDYLATRRSAFVASIETALGRSVQVVFAYDATLNGIAIELSSAEAATVANLPGVERVERDRLQFLQTDNGPDWIGAPAIWSGTGTAGAPGTRGEGVIVGVIDTGINHDHPSFAEVGGDGFVHTNPRGTYYGACDPLTGLPFCNDKLIGAWDFTGTTPEDTHLHGSHTASTAAGNVLDAELVAPTITIERAISGVAPHANLITYKACVTSCPITSILASINQATMDMVDVINYSIGGASSDPWADLDAQAFLNARRAGIFVSASAGNEGPGAATVGSPSDSPWVLSVGANTHDRKFINRLIGMAGGASAPPANLDGAGITAGHGPAPIVYAGDYGDPLCPTPFPPGTWTNGEIVVCDRGVNPRVEKAQNVATGGAEGFVLANEEASGDSIVADAYVIPGLNITHDDGVILKAWIGDDGSGHTATITGMVIEENASFGDVMAAFSSRGENPSVPDVIKPDITAPGVDIFAAFNTVNPLGPPEYGVISGTSMSSPHAAGSAALIRGLNPLWTPDEVRSAMMTTSFTDLPGNQAEVHGVLKEDGVTPADPFDMGAGRVDLTQAGQAGLVLDESPANYDAANPALGGDPTTLNLASLGDAACDGTCSWTRTVEGTRSTSWTVSTTAPAGMTLTVTPSTFSLATGAPQELTIEADVNGLADGGWAFGEVELVPADGTIPPVHLPVAVQPGEDGSAVPQTTLYFHGNLHDGCTGDGRTDIVACNGPFLAPDEELDTAQAARWVAEPGLDGTADRNIYDPNWIWHLAEPTTVGGDMTVEWWAGCPACSVFGDDWTIRVWADGALAFTERVTASGGIGEVSRRTTTVALPEISATTSIVLHVDPVFIDTQHGTTIYYDSIEPCSTLGDLAPCDSLVRMPILSGGEVEPPPMPDLEVTAMEAGRTSPRASERATITATVSNTGEGAAGASVTEFVLDDGEVLGLADTPSLEPGESADVSVEWDTRGQNGEHTITATADASELVAESDESNNSATLTVTVRGNKVQNGSFEQANADEDDPEAWSGSDTDAGTTAWSEGGSHGERSVTITGTGGNALLAGVPTWTSDPVAVTAGEVLILSASVEVDGASTAPTVGLAYLDAAGELLEAVAVLTAPLSTDGFEVLEETVTVPAGVAEVQVVLAGFAALDLATAGTVTFDDVGLFATE